MTDTRLGVDVGGTFTDLVALVDGALVTAKVPSTPHDQSAGVMAAIAAAAIEPRAVEAFAHGMTVATNALLERRGARTALVTTAGFRDLLEIGRQDRPSLYDLTRDRPTALVPRELRFVVHERMGPDGVLVPLDETSLTATIEAIRAAEVEAVAVCLLFSFRHPQHEQRVGAALRAALPDVRVALSSDVLPEMREYERCATTTVDAYLGPRLASYFDRLATRAREAEMPAPLVMQSSGGVIEIDVAADHAASCVLSGPAGGVVGAAFVAAASGHEDVLTFDMGGTSTDVAPVIAGEARTSTEAVVAGVPLRLPMVDVHTVSAGGGSIAWADEGGALRVGPHSAGAEPGPAAYGQGGEQPTVTDANLALGYLADGAQLGGSVTLDRKRALEALERLGAKLGLEGDAVALGVTHVADAEMVRALRVVSVERGLDPRELALVAFGGAGGMHACSLAEELGMTTILIPRASGVLSALGLAIGDLRRDYASALVAPLEALEETELERCFSELERTARADLAGCSLRRRADLRYRGQAFELTIDADQLDQLADRFHAAHESRAGYRMDEEPIELVAVRVVATVVVDAPELRDPEPADDAGPPSRRRAYFDGNWVEVDVHPRAALGAGSTIDGPAIVEFAEATCVVRPGWRGEIDVAGTLILDRREAA